MNFDPMSFVAPGVVVLCAILMIIFRIVYRKQPLRGLRSIPAFNHLRQAIGLAVEDGSRLHVSLGNASINSQQAASALVGLSTLERITQLSATSDQPPVATSGSGGLAILSQDTLRGAYQNSNSIEMYDPAQGRLTGPTPFSYIAGTLPVLHDEMVSANVFVGNFGPEIGLLVDRAEQQGSFTIAGSDSLPAQAVLYITSSEPLIGEEVFASGAYLQTNPFHPASLRAQDILKWLVFASVIVGIILKINQIYMKLPIATAVAIAIGLVVLAGYFFRPMFDPLLSVLMQWAIVLAGVATIVGIVNLLSMHWKKVQMRKNGMGYSLVAIVACLITVLVGIFLGANSQAFQWVVTNIQVPVEASLLAILVVTLAYASFRLLSRRSITLLSGSFILSALVFLIFNIGFLTASLSSLDIPFFNRVVDIIRELPVGGTRGLLVGIALGTLATGLRIILGGDRPYTG